MPIFISYSHKDKLFVDKLAGQLVRLNVHVWLDRWELSVGDSLIDKIQQAVDGASALIVILSKASVVSEWCKKELSAGLLRELEEKRVVVMPVLLEDCEIPIFARGKMYADFRSNFDEGLGSIVGGIAKVTNPSLARIKGPTYHTDWSIDWGNIDEEVVLVLNFIQLPLDQPYTCHTNISILASAEATRIFHTNTKIKGIEFAKLHILKIFKNTLAESKYAKLRLSDEREAISTLVFSGKSKSEEYGVRISSRRMGEDTGKDILVNITGLVSDAFKHMENVLERPKSE